jgi:hypothetical protein
MNIISSSFVKPEKIYIILVEHGLFVIFEMIREPFLLVRLILWIIDSPRCIVKFFIVFFLLQDLWQFDRFHHFSKLLSCF